MHPRLMQSMLQLSSPGVSDMDAAGPASERVVKGLIYQESARQELLHWTVIVCATPTGQCGRKRFFFSAVAIDGKSAY